MGEGEGPAELRFQRPRRVSRDSCNEAVIHGRKGGSNRSGAREVRRLAPALTAESLCRGLSAGEMRSWIRIVTFRTEGIRGLYRLNPVAPEAFLERRDDLGPMGRVVPSVYGVRSSTVRSIQRTKNAASSAERIGSPSAITNTGFVCANRQLSSVPCCGGRGSGPRSTRSRR